MENIHDYSEKEIKLLKALGLEEQMSIPSMFPSLLYSTAVVYKCFMEEKFQNTVIAESVRRCVKELEKGFKGIGRGTKEWDDLIEL